MPFNLDNHNLKKANDLKSSNPIEYIERTIAQFNKIMEFAYEQGTGEKIEKSNVLERFSSIKTDINTKLSETIFLVPSVISYNKVFDLTIEKFQIRTITELNIINDDDFKKILLGFFDKIDDINLKERKNLIKEALKLYELNLFAGCLCLLLCQLEGIITDYLIYKKVITKKKCNGKTKYTHPDYCQDLGLHQKIEISKKKFGENFERLANYIFDDNNEYKINNERNEILHGSNINNFTAERCYWIFIWITSILSFIEKNT